MGGGVGNQELALVAPLAGSARASSAARERALVKAAQRGSEEAIEALIARHWDDVHRAAFLIVHDREAAEDIALETMLAAVDSLQHFNRRRPLLPWLRRIAVNRALDHLRKPHRARELSVQEVRAEEWPDDQREGLLEEIVQALRTLGPEDRALIVYRHLWGYRPREIARSMDIQPATVRTRLHRALAKLRSELEIDRGSA
jgi:RNA polymerase sigma-70 factor (ECF subfamily)